VKNHDLSANPIVYTAKDIALCVNGYLQNFYPNENCIPTRSQVFITKPIPNLKFKGIFFFNDDVYFREYQGRILFGGGRHHDRENENSMEEKNTEKIMSYL